MSRSNPPRSPIAEKVRHASAGAGQAASPVQRSFGRTFKFRLAAWMRWLHIYLSMFGLASVLFFSVTGLTLNHPDWFFAGAQSRVEAEGQVDVKWLHLTPPPPAEGEEPDPSLGVAKLEVVEHLRKAHGLRGALA